MSGATTVIEADTALGATAVDKAATAHRALGAAVIVATPPPFPFLVFLDDLCVVYLDDLDVCVVYLDDLIIYKLAWCPASIFFLLFL
jgi:hypothetical protein